MSQNSLVLVRCSNFHIESRFTHLNRFVGHRNLWLPRCSCRGPAGPSRIPCQRVRHSGASDQLTFSESVSEYRTVRPAKVPANREAFAVYGDAVEVIGFDDIVKGSYADALKGKLRFTMIPEFRSFLVQALIPLFTLLRLSWAVRPPRLQP